jgi:hypothetical protein
VKPKQNSNEKLSKSKLEFFEVMKNRRNAQFWSNDDVAPSHELKANSNDEKEEEIIDEEKYLQMKNQV